MNLRAYRPEDAAVILSWIRDERAFRRWSADRYDAYPILPEDMNAHYAAMTGSGCFFPMTAEEDGSPLGHLILRYPGEDRRIIRFGFIIIDERKRGCGIGKAMLHLAADHAFRELGAEKITLGVFADNLPALRCYRSAGFREIPTDKPEIFHILDEDWPCLEMELERK